MALTATSPEFLAICKRHAVDPSVMAAMVTVESAWNPHAIRYEPPFQYLHEVEERARECRISPATETACQKFSVGLGQIMFGTARWHGYRGSFAALFAPEENIEWCCRHYAWLSKRYTTAAARVAAYNAGSVRWNAAGSYVNQNHVDKFMRAWRNA